MEYNKNQYQKTDDKKVLHKIGKSWKVVSLSLLMALGGIGAVSTTTHADTANADQNNNKQTAKTNSPKAQIPQRLVKNETHLHRESTPVNITKQANALHNRILANAAVTAKNKPTAIDSQNNNAKGYQLNLPKISQGNNSKNKATKNQNNQPKVGDERASDSTAPNGINTEGSTLYIKNFTGSDPAGQGKQYDTNAAEIRFVGNNNLIGNWGQAFQSDSNLQEITKSDNATVDTGNMTNMYEMFYGDTSLSNIDALSNWNTGSVTNMGQMFEKDKDLSNIDALSNWNTSNVTNMTAIFADNTSLSNVNGLSNWNTSNLTNMNDMFGGDKDLSNIDALSNWNTNSVTSMTEMFSDDHLSNVNALSNWNTSNVTNMDYMFEGDKDLSNIDALSNWNTNNVTSAMVMFMSDTYLINRTPIPNWNIDKYGWVTPLGHTGTSRESDTFEYYFANGNSDNIIASAKVNSVKGVRMPVHSYPTGIPKGYKAADPNQEITFNGGTYKIAIEPIQYIADIINYIYNSNQKGSYIVSGNPGSTDNLTNSDNLPTGYQLTNDGSQTITLNGGNHNVNITPIRMTHTINYQSDGGTSEGSHTFSGNDWQAAGASDTSFTLNSGSYPSDIAQFYHIENTQTFNYDNGSSTVKVAPDNVTNIITYMYNGSQEGQTTMSGPYGKTVSPDSSNMPNGYELDGNQSILLNNGSDSINIKPIPETDTINYQSDGGTPEGSYTFTGNDAAASGAVNTAVTISNTNDPGIASNYHVKAPQKFPYDGGTHTVIVASNTVNDTVDYMYNGHQKGSYSVSGNPGSTDNLTNSDNLPTGYQLKDDGSQTITLNGGSHNVDITPLQKGHTINYQLSDGTSEGSHTFSGNDADASGASDTSFQLASGTRPDGLNPHYHIENTATYHYDGGTDTVTVAPDLMSDTVDYDYNGGTIGSTVMKGDYGSIATPDGSNLPSGYQLVSGQTFQYNGGMHQIYITPIQETDTIDYQLDDGTPEGSYTFTGNDAAASGADNTTVTINNSNDPGIYDHYHVHGSQTFFYDGRTHVVIVDPDTVGETINYLYKGSPKGHTTMYGTYGSTQYADGSNMPQGYEMDGDPSIHFDGDSYSVNVKPISMSHTVIYQSDGGVSEGSYTFHGNDWQANGASDTYVTLASGSRPDGLTNPHYHVETTHTLAFNNGTDVIKVAPDTTTDTIDYLYKGHLKNTTKMSGPYGKTVKPDGSNLPSGYQLMPDQTFQYDGGTHQINITPIRQTAHVKYQLTNGTPEGSDTLTGNSSDASGASDTHATISDGNEPGITPHYHVKGSVNVGFNNGSDVVTVDPDTMSDTIDFMYNDNQVKSLTVKGAYGTIWNSAGQLPQGFELTGDGSQNFTYNGTVHTVNVKPLQKTDTIRYMYNGTNEVASDISTGNDYQAAQYGISDTSLTIDNSSHPDLPAGYHLVNSVNTFNYDGNTHDVAIAPNKVTVTVHYMDDGAPKGTYQVTGNDYRAVAAGNNEFTIDGSHQPGITAGYSVTGSHAINFDPADPNPQIQVAGDEHNPGSNPEPYPSNGGNIPNPNPDQPIPNDITPGHSPYTPANGDKASDTFYVVINQYTNGKFLKGETKQFTFDARTGDHLTVRPSDSNLMPLHYHEAFGDNPQTLDMTANGLDDHVVAFNYDADAAQDITVDYVNQDDAKVYSDVQHGDYDQKLTVDSLPTADELRGYTLNSPSQTDTFGGTPQTMTVQVLGDQHNPSAPGQILPTMPTSPSDAANAVTVKVKKLGHAGQSLGSDVRYIEEDGRTGDSFTLHPSDFTPQGFTEDPRYDDGSNQGRFTADGLSPNHVTFVYDATENAADDITVNYVNQHGDTVATNRISGYTGDQGSVYDASGLQMPEGYHYVDATDNSMPIDGASGDSIPYQITDHPQTITIQIDGNQINNSSYNPITPKPSDSSNTKQNDIQNNAAHGYVTYETVEMSGDVTVKDEYHCVNENGKHVGDSFSIDAPTEQYYNLDSSLSSVNPTNGVVAPDGSLSYTSPKFVYKSVADNSIMVYYINQNSDIVGKKKISKAPGTRIWLATSELAQQPDMPNGYTYDADKNDADGISWLDFAGSGQDADVYVKGNPETVTLNYKYNNSPEGDNIVETHVGDTVQIPNSGHGMVDGFEYEGDTNYEVPYAASGNIQHTVPVVPNGHVARGTVKIEYLDAQNGYQQVGSTITKQGYNGDTLDPSSYVDHVPAGYTEGSVEGGLRDFTYDSRNDANVVRIDVKEGASAPVEYVDDATGNEVPNSGQTYHGARSDVVDLAKYESYVPSGYSYDGTKTIADATNNQPLQAGGANGARIVYVHKDTNSPAIGTINVEYDDLDDNDNIVGSESLTSRAGDKLDTGIFESIIPTGYDHADLPAGSPLQMIYQTNPQTLHVYVHEISNTKIEYVDVGDTQDPVSPQIQPGNYPIVGEHVAKVDVGRQIPLDSYAAYLPNGYETVAKNPADSANFANTNSPVAVKNGVDYIYVRKANPQAKYSTITIHYVDATNNKPIDNVQASGRAGDPFSISAYENDLPSGYQFGHLQKELNVFPDADSNQASDTVYVTPVKPRTYGRINVDYVVQGQTKPIESVTVRGHDGGSFDLDPYKHSVPNGYHLVGTKNAGLDHFVGRQINTIDLEIAPN